MIGEEIQSRLAPHQRGSACPPPSLLSLGRSRWAGLALLLLQAPCKLQAPMLPAEQLLACVAWCVVQRCNQPPLAAAALAHFRSPFSAPPPHASLPSPDRQDAVSERTCRLRRHSLRCDTWVFRAICRPAAAKARTAPRMNGWGGNASLILSSLVTASRIAMGLWRRGQAWATD